MSNEATRGVQLSSQERAALRRLAEKGEREAAEQLNLNPHTFARCAAGFRVNRSTAALVRHRLAELTAQGPT
jgi:hypothetical protein